MDTLTAMQALASEFTHAHDAKDAKEVASCFAKSASHLGYQGRAGIEQLFTEIYETQTARRRHVLTNFVLTRDEPAVASVCCYELLYLIRGDSVDLVITGLYEVDAVKEDGAWKVTRLEPHLDLPYDPGDTPMLAYLPAADGTYRLARS